MRALLIGYGKMGHLIAELAPQYNVAISSVIDSHSDDFSDTAYPALTEEAIENCDIVIDFSSAKDICQRIFTIASAKKPMIIGTTGWEKEMPEAKKIIHDCKGSLLYAANFSLGVAIFSKLVSYAGELFSGFSQYDVGIIETHHRLKQDAPSGTAYMVADKLMRHYPHKKLELDLGKSEALKEDAIHISSHRSGYHPGTHEVVFDSKEDSISITHCARNREGFAKGALEAAFWLIDKKGWYTLDDMIEEKIHSKIHTKK